MNPRDDRFTAVWLFLKRSGLDVGGEKKLGRLVVGQGIEGGGEHERGVDSSLVAS